jgi:hypothetical protein
MKRRMMKMRKTLILMKKKMRMKRIRKLTIRNSTMKMMKMMKSKKVCL